MVTNEYFNRQLFNAILDVMLVIDDKGIIVLANRQTEKVFGYQKQELIGKKVEMLIPGKFRTKHQIYREEYNKNPRVRPMGQNLNIYGLCKNGNEIPVEVSLSHQSIDGQLMVLCAIRDITERKNAEKEKEKQIRLQQLLLELSSGFLNLPIDKIDPSINDALAKLGEFVNADRSYIFDYDFEKGVTNNIYEWCREGIEPQIDNLQAIPLGGVSDWVNTHKKGEKMYVPDVLSLPKGSLRDILEPQEIKSLITIPLMKNNECFGFVGFDSVRHHQAYTETEQHLLEVFGEMLVNIKKHTESELKLRESEERFRTLFENAHTGIYQTTPDGRILTANPALIKMLGYSSLEDLQNRDLEMDYAYAGSTRESFKQQIEQKNIITNLESKWITKKHDEITVIENARVVRDKSGNTLYYEGFVENITERRLAEKTIQEQAIKYSTMLSTIDEGFWLVNDKGRLLEVNDAYCKMSGYSKEELLNLSIPDLEAFETPEETSKQIQLVTEKGTETFERSHRAKDGSIIDVEVTTAFWKEKSLFFAFIKDITERKKAEEKLKKANRLYTVLSNVNQSIVRINDKQQLFDEVCRIAVEDGNFKMVWIGMVNEATQKVEPVASLGAAGDYLAEIDIDLKHPERSRGQTGQAIKTGKHYLVRDISRNPRMEPWRKNALKQGYHSSASFPLIVFGKTTGAFSLYSGEPFFFDREEIKLLEELVTDISFALEVFENEKKRKQTENNLRRAENIANMGYYQFNLETNRIIDMSSTLYQIWDFEQDLLPAFHEFTSKIHQDDLEEALKVFNDSVKNKKGLDIEYRIIPRKGEEKFIRSIGELNQDNEGIWHLFGTIADITEIKEREKDISILSQSVESSLSSVALADPGGILLYVNPACVNMFGYTRKEEMIGKDALDFWESKELAQEVINTLMAGKKWIAEMKAQKKDGTLIDVFVLANIISDSRGKPICMHATLQDITDRKQYEANLEAALEKAQESDRLKSAFLANVSHEIRTPMNGIMGFSQLLNEPQLSPDEVQTFIGMIEKSGKRMMNTIDDLVEISMIEAGQVNINYSEVNLNDELEYLKVFFEPQIRGKGIKISCRKGLPNMKCIIRTDKEKLLGIYMNLLQNAIKYTNEGKIECGYEKKDGILRFFVKDTGIGIPQDKLEAIFDRFVQADLSLTKSYEGAGLGLSISKAYVEMLGGKIGVKSEEGKGSQFFFTLPDKFTLLSKKETEEKQEVKEDVSEGDKLLKKLSVLVAEDDEISLIYLSKLFEGKCRRISFAKNGQEAVELYKNNGPFDVVLMDIKMPVMDGYAATIKIKEHDKNAFIIAQTAYAFSGDREKALAAGCEDYISKPIKKESLFSIVNKKFKR